MTHVTTRSDGGYGRSDDQHPFGKTVNLSVTLWYDNKEAFRLVASQR
jgi:hypothetical protein